MLTRGASRADPRSIGLPARSPCADRQQRTKATLLEAEGVDAVAHALVLLQVVAAGHAHARLHVALGHQRLAHSHRLLCAHQRRERVDHEALRGGKRRASSAHAAPALQPAGHRCSPSRIRTVTASTAARSKTVVLIAVRKLSSGRDTARYFPEILIV